MFGQDALKRGWMSLKELARYLRGHTSSSSSSSSTGASGETALEGDDEISLEDGGSSRDAEARTVGETSTPTGTGRVPFRDRDVQLEANEEREDGNGVDDEEGQGEDLDDACNNNDDDDDNIDDEDGEDEDSDELGDWTLL